MYEVILRSLVRIRLEGQFFAKLFHFSFKAIEVDLIMPQSNHSWPSHNSIKYVKINKSLQESICNLKELSAVFSMSTANEVLYGESPPRGPTPYPFMYCF